MRHLSTCPLCQEHNLVQYLQARDHTVSHETFYLDKCNHCGFVLTNPRPEDYSLPGYYKSDAYISHANKSNNLINQLYKISRHFTLTWKYDVIQNYSAGTPSSLLDFGCGTGAFLQQCKKQKLAITGVEPAASARTHAEKSTGATIHASLAELSGTFDVITAWHVIEHVPDIHESLRTLHAHLAPQGTMFIAVPNLLSYDAKHYGEYWAAYDVPRHLWHFSRATMKALAAQHGFQVVTMLPMYLDAYYVSLLSEKYKSPKRGVSNMPRALITGWKSNRRARKTGEYSSIIYILRK